MDEMLWIGKIVECKNNHLAPELVVGGMYQVTHFRYNEHKVAQVRLYGKLHWYALSRFKDATKQEEEKMKELPPMPPEAQPPSHVALGEELVAVDVQKKNKYTREIKPNVFVDVYDVLRAFKVTDPCLSHLCKKTLAAGIRGHKDRLTDLQDIKASIERAIEMHIEWEK